MSVIKICALCKKKILFCQLELHVAATSINAEHNEYWEILETFVIMWQWHGN